MNDYPSEREILDFVQYCFDFYGVDEGIYAEDLSNGVGYTFTQIYDAVEEYLSSSIDSWGGGDTFDRENVIRILDPRYGRNLI